MGIATVTLNLGVVVVLQCSLSLPTSAFELHSFPADFSIVFNEYLFLELLYKLIQSNIFFEGTVFEVSV